MLLDKPAGLSSNAALQRVRRALRARKAGHTGSLDPLATGLLPICLGEATKASAHLLGSDKAYETVAQLGVVTDSADAEGSVLERRVVVALDADRIEAALAPLRGRIRQVPPALSALKQGGVPLYRRVRRGETVEVPAREVEVRRLELIGIEVPDRLRLYVECGSGTYVRALVRDLGEALGCGAHVVMLRRLWVEPFRMPVMVGLDALEEAAERGDEAFLSRSLLPLSAALAHLDVLGVDDAEAALLRAGRFLPRPLPGGPATVAVALDSTGRAVALLEEAPGGGVKAARVFLPAVTSGPPSA
ncbi:MAG TPA: tRNA pseudouridine(55) synthase TruB [Xanthomonadaceae bacterium]|nr:tRNA pseudouridine(55) synthase TruB [Xanthomonadaceae bacterium]